MLGYSTIGSTPLAAALRRATLRAGRVAATCQVVPAIPTAPRDIPAGPLAVVGGPDPVAATASAEVSAATITTDIQPTAVLPGGGVTRAFFAIDAAAVPIAAPASAPRTIPAEALFVEGNFPAATIAPGVVLEPSAIGLEAGQLGPLAAADASIDLAALELPGLVGAAVSAAGRAVSVSAISDIADLAGASVVPGSALQPSALAIRAAEWSTNASAAAALDPVALEAVGAPAAGVVAAPRTVFADAITLKNFAGDASPGSVMEIRPAPFELEAGQLATLADVGVAIDVDPIELQGLALAATAAAGRAVAVAAMRATLEPGITDASAEAVFALGTLEVKPFASSSSADVAAAVSPAAFDVVLLTPPGVPLGTCSIQASAIGLSNTLGATATDSGGTLRPEAFSCRMAMPTMAADASGAIVSAAVPVAAGQVATLMQVPREVPATAIRAELRAGDGQPLAVGEFRTGALEVAEIPLPVARDAGALLQPTTIVASAGVPAVTIGGGVLVELPALALEAGVAAWRGIGPVLIGPPDLVYELEPNWAYYAVADNLAFYELTANWAGYDLGDNLAWYQLEPNWGQFDLADNLAIYTIES